MKSMLITTFMILLFNSWTFSQSSGSWKGSALPGKVYAEFKDFTGKQDFKVSVPVSTQKIHLKYDISIDNGELTLIIKSSSNIVLTKKIKGKDTSSITFNKNINENYKIYLKGKDAEGSFNITYTYDNL